MKKFNGLKIRLSSILILLAIIGWSSNSFAQWQTNGSNIYYNSGNVGIGTDSPSTPLGISSSDGYFLRLERTGAFNPGVFEFIISNGAGSEGDAEIWTEAGFALRTNWGDWSFVTTKDGDIGMGTTSPDEKLEVVGKIKSSGPNSALILTSPDGTAWAITIDNSGTLSATQSTKVLEVENSADINIFPNPTENKVTIELETNEIQNISTELYDISGKIVYMKSYKTNSVILDINDFESGTYILKVKNSNGKIIKTEKIVKK